MTNYKKDEIYIDCQPVNSEGETLVETKEREKEENAMNFSVEKIFKNPFLAFIIGVLLLLVFGKIINVMINKMYKATENIRLKGGNVMDD